MRCFILFRVKEDVFGLLLHDVFAAILFSSCVPSCDVGLEEIYSSAPFETFLLIISVRVGVVSGRCVFALNNPQGCYCFARAEQIRDMSFGNE